MYYKLNRLLNPYAWRSWFSFEVIFIHVLIIVALWLQAAVIPEQNRTGWLNIIFYVLCPAVCIFVSVDKISSPYKIIFGKEGKPDVCIYKEKHKGGRKYWRIVVKDGGKTDDIFAEDFEVLFEGLPTDTLLVYLSEDTKEYWYLWRANAEPKHLGIRINDILYRSREDNKLTALSYLDVREFTGECIAGKDVYIPEGVDTINMEGIKKKTPDEVMLVKEGCRYESWGFYLSSKLPYYHRVILSSAIIRENDFQILLTWNKVMNRYTVVHKSKALSRRLSCWFCDLDDKYDIGGRISRYYAGSKRLQYVYNGRFLSIDFDNGLIQGTDGKVYGGK